MLITGKAIKEMSIKGLDFNQINRNLDFFMLGDHENLNNMLNNHPNSQNKKLFEALLKNNSKENKNDDKDNENKP